MVEAVRGPLDDPSGPQAPIVFFFQAEDGIRDLTVTWSSDVCSSDLHAVATAAALAELEALDGDDLDAGLAERGVAAGVALVGDDNAGLDGDHVVAVVPLLALGLDRKSVV